jgi:hypothetical protein
MLRSTTNRSPLGQPHQFSGRHFFAFFLFSVKKKEARQQAKSRLANTVKKTSIAMLMPGNFSDQK